MSFENLDEEKSDLNQKYKLYENNLIERPASQNI